MPKVSVIIPVYNVEQYLKECLDSVLNQTYCDYEIIVVNDGSTDGSINILSDYANINQKVKVITTKNQGQSIARNVGIDIATGDYIIFLDSDDKISEKTLEICIKEIEEKKIDAIFFGSEVIVDGVDPELKNNFFYQRPNALFDKIINGEIFFLESIKSSKYFVSPCMYMFSRESLGALRFYPKVLHEDNIFTTKLLLSGRLKRVCCLNENFYQRRLRPGSIMTQEKTRKHLDGYLIVARELVKEKSKITDIAVELALANFIAQILHGILFLAVKFHRFWVPLSFRKEILYLAYKNNNLRHRFFLMIRSSAPHLYFYLQKIQILFCRAEK